MYFSCCLFLFLVEWCWGGVVSFTNITKQHIYKLILWNFQDRCDKIQGVGGGLFVCLFVFYFIFVPPGQSGGRGWGAFLWQETPRNHKPPLCLVHRSIQRSCYTVPLYMVNGWHWAKHTLLNWCAASTNESWLSFRLRMVIYHISSVQGYFYLSYIWFIPQ